MILARQASLLLASLLLASACGTEAPPPPALGAAFQVQPPAGSLVVARVNGAPILESDVAAQMAGGRDARAALEELVQLELLAQEAGRRGLDRAPEVLRTQRKALANAVIRRGFGDSFTTESVPDRMVQMAYERARARFVHAELVRVNHILAMATQDDPPEKHARARKLAEEIHQAVVAAGPMSEKDFLQLGKTMDEKNPGLTVVAETMTTDLRGRTVREFADAAFAMSREGQISPVVKTRFGFHVLRYVKRYPPENRSLSEAAPEIRAGIFDQARRVMFQNWVKELGKEAGVQVHPEVLDQALGRKQPGEEG